MSDLTKEEKDELLLGLSCHSSHEVESTFITMAQMIKNLECQLEEAREGNRKFFKAGLFACDDNRWNDLIRKRSEDDVLEELYQNYKKQLKEKGE